MYEFGYGSRHLGLKDKFCRLSFSYILLIMILACVGTMTLYSAANGSWDPWAIKHISRFGVTLLLMIGLAMVDIRYYYHGAYLFYFATLFLLVVVEITGHIGMGAQRWINLGLFKIQPSELMKIGMVLFLARYFSFTTMQNIRTIRGILIPVVLTIIPVGLICLQPDLGTALMLLFTATIMMFVVGVQWWKFALVGAAGAALLPIAWNFLHEYQQNRVLTFLDPERDPLGAGYHIIQSKIAFGSGGIFGKGFLHGTQTHLNFLPEKHTDFIFTMFSEEFGMIGSVMLVLLNILVIAMGYIFAFRIRNYFAKLVVIGLNTNYFLYVFINIAMVMGVLPVVGIPLPLISYGGTVMFSIMSSFGIILCMKVNQDNNINFNEDD
ncbi:MAG: rod shape-determining protein RodA [Alphaproteobacteria bacterium]|nr:rod shape-determining protein RodA [Alphaproteobacteria bacterium]